MAAPKRKKYESRFKPWIEHQGQPILGTGRARLLRDIDELHSIREAAVKLDIPYRSAWEHIRKIEDAIGTPVIKTHRGGAQGGGGSELTEEGKRLLHEYDRYERYLEELSADEELWEALKFKVSTRNKLSGVVKQVEIDELAASIRIEIETPRMLKALITKDAVDELDIDIGDEVEAVIKATEVMIAKE